MFLERVLISDFIRDRKSIRICAHHFVASLLPSHPKSGYVEEKKRTFPIFLTATEPHALAIFARPFTPFLFWFWPKRSNNQEKATNQ
jgi:hypothetical protein